MKLAKDTFLLGLKCWQVLKKESQTSKAKC